MLGPGPHRPRVPGRAVGGACPARPLPGPTGLHRRMPEARHDRGRPHLQAPPATEPQWGGHHAALRHVPGGGGCGATSMVRPLHYPLLLPWCHHVGALFSCLPDVVLDAQVANDTPAGERLSQEADDIEQTMATEFASRSAQVGIRGRPAVRTHTSHTSRTRATLSPMFHRQGSPCVVSFSCCDGLVYLLGYTGSA